MKRSSLLLACSLGACVPEFDVRSSIVENARLLAVVAEPPEVRPGASVRLAALAANPEGRDPAPSIAVLRDTRGGAAFAEREFDVTR